VSVAVELDALPEQIARFGRRAFLVTNSSDGPPHLASVVVTFEGDDLAMGAGRKTRANAASRPAVTLMWTAPAETEHCLIVDGTAHDADAETFLVSPTSAILHRLAQ
jgi:hypothetical protein